MSVIQERQDAIMPDKSLSVVVPIFNEEDSIILLHNSLVDELARIFDTFNLDGEIVYVDDGSADNSAEILAFLPASSIPVRVIALSRNFGKEAAIRAGLDFLTCEAALFMDGDGQHPVSMISTFVDLWIKEQYDVVYAVRKKRDDGFVKNFLIHVFYKIMNSGSKVHITANAGDFRLLSSKALQAVQTLKEREQFFKGLSLWVGFRQCAVPYTPTKRIAGHSKWSVLQLFALSMTGLTSFSTSPLRTVMLFGAFLATLSFIYGFWLILQNIFFGGILGYSLLITAIVFFSSIQIVMIGILGEYVVSILREAKLRPSYIVDSFKHISQ